MRLLLLPLAAVLFLACGARAPDAPTESPPSAAGMERVAADPPSTDPVPAPDAGTDAPVATVECETDADCVPASCCHPIRCVGRASAPSCEEVACSAHCEGGTLDCGQGHCLCFDGRCGTSLSGPPLVPEDASWAP